METHSVRATPWMSRPRLRPVSRRVTQNFTMASWESEKVRKTLIEYIITSAVMSPRV